MSFRGLILETITRVAREQERTLAPLTDDLPLEETGLDSLCWAVIVARLEETIGVDPFSESEQGRFPVTLGDLIRVYDAEGS